MELLIFYPLAIACVLLALGVVFNNSPIGSAVSLVGMMLCLAGVFVLLQAHFLAILQVIIYAGAIMVLFMFVIMLLNLSDEELGKDTITVGKSVGAAALGFIAVKISLIVSMSADKFQKGSLDPEFGTIDSVGDLLFRQFLFLGQLAQNGDHTLFGPIRAARLIHYTIPS